MGMSELIDYASTNQSTDDLFQGNSDDTILQDRVEKVRDILDRASADHHLYESTTLNGVRDENWPAFYAQNALCRGLVGALGYAENDVFPSSGEGLPKTIAYFLEWVQAPSEWSRVAAEMLVKNFGKEIIR